MPKLPGSPFTLLACLIGVAILTVCTINNCVHVDSLYDDYNQFMIENPAMPPYPHWGNEPHDKNDPRQSDKE